MRIGFGGIFHETNSFAVGTTGLDDFKAYQFAEGPELLSYRQTRSELGGFIAVADENGWDLVPGIFAAAIPSGMVDQEVFDRLADSLIDRLVAARPDGILLCLHGAMVTTADEDPEGTLVERLVAETGGDVAISVTVDFHANLSDRIARGVDAIVGYDTYPHVDMYDRGREAARALQSVLQSGRRRTTVHQKHGIITPAQVQYTDTEPLRQLIRLTHEAEAGGDLVVSVTPGFAYSDVACAGLSVVASSASSSLAKDAARSLIAGIAGVSEGFRYDSISVPEAVDRAISSQGLTVLVDSADNVGGGSPGDGTAILQEWLRRGGNGLVTTIADPETVAAALSVGVGGTIEVALGGKTDSRHGDPVDVTAYVKLISDGSFVHRGSYETGFVVRMGKTAVLHAHGNVIVVTERKVMPFDAEQLLSLGVHPAHHRAMVVKSAIAWRAGFGEFARDIIEVDTPGICTANLASLALSADRAARIWPGTALRDVAASQPGQGERSVAV